MRNRTKGNKVKEKKKILKRRKRGKEWERAGRGGEGIGGEINYQSSRDSDLSILITSGLTNS